jgi:hypothetical protein
VSTTARLGLPAVSCRERLRKGELMCRAMLGHASVDALPRFGNRRGMAARRAHTRWNGVPTTWLG